MSRITRKEMDEISDSLSSLWQIVRGQDRFAQELENRIRAVENNQNVDVPAFRSGNSFDVVSARADSLRVGDRVADVGPIGRNYPVCAISHLGKMLFVSFLVDESQEMRKTMTEDKIIPIIRRSW